MDTCRGKISSQWYDKKIGGQVGKYKKTISAAGLIDKRGGSRAGCRPGGHIPASWR